MTETKDQKHTEIFLRKVPEDLKRQFKMACAQEKKTMREVLLESMARYIREMLHGKGE